MDNEHRWVAVFGLVIFLASAMVLNADTPDNAALEYTTLGTREQLHLDDMMLRLLSRPEIRKQRETARTALLAEPVASTPAGKATLERALDGITAAMVQCGINSDSEQPQVAWLASAAHRWFGRALPDSGYGIENPDNVYRTIPMDGRSRYEVIGRLRRPGPSQLSFTLYATRPNINAETPLPQEGSGLIGALTDVITRADGSFVVTVDPDPANGRTNHIQSAQPTALLIVRDTLGNWEMQQVTQLEVRRVGGPDPGPPRSEKQFVAMTLRCMQQQIPLWMAYYNQKFIFSQPANQVLDPRIRPVGWGLSRSAHFKLASDEALMVTVDPIGAQYLGFQLADPWGMSLEYIGRTGSLNHAQARANSDSTFTYVISPQDPGVHNWLDTSGLDAGILAIRWQDFAEPVNASTGAVREAKLVKHAKLRSALPEGTVYVTAEERKNQLEMRATHYERRLTE